MRATVAALVLLLIVPKSSFAQVSPFNGIEVKSAADGAYRLIITGHIHGSSRDRSGFPASTILGNIDRINSLNADIFLSTGDLFMDPEKEIAQYEHTFFNKLNVPLFNVPGNHDRSGTYLEKYGPTHGVIDIGEDRIILLDTERDDGKLDDAQLKLLEDQMVSPAPRNVFIISHRPLWAENDKTYSKFFEGNTRSLLSTNFEGEVRPLIERIAENSHVHWISGSMAGAAPTSFFFQRHARNITFIQSAIRNEYWDALLIADVRNGNITWSGESLTGEPLLAPEAYDAELWSSLIAKKEPFNWRLVPYLMKTAVSHMFFWYGAIAAIVLMLLLRLFLRRVI